MIFFNFTKQLVYGYIITIEENRKRKMNRFIIFLEIIFIITFSLS